LVLLGCSNAVGVRLYPGILAYLQRIGGREAYRRAMQKGGLGLQPMLT
jgi:glutathione S-transferase